MYIAAVLGSETLRQYLINYARPLIYSTFMSFNCLASIKCSYDLLESGETMPVKILVLSLGIRLTNHAIFLAASKPCAQDCEKIQGINTVAIRYTITIQQSYPRYCLER